MEMSQILKELRRHTEALYGVRLKNITLYGSWARKEATADSDIDVAIALKGLVQPCREIDRLIDMITEMNLKYGILLSVYPISEEDYNSVKSPLLLTIRRDGASLKGNFLCSL